MSKIPGFVVEAFFLLILPVFILMWSRQALALRPILMGIGGVYCAWRLWVGRATPASLGIRSAGFTASLRSLAAPSIILVLITYLLFLCLPPSALRFFVGYDPLTVNSFVERLLAYLFLSSPVQELIFRGYLTWRLKQVFHSQYLVQIISVGLFTFVHLPFYSPLLLFISAAMGVMYVWVYYRDHNLWAPIISHSVVGACIIIIRNTWFPY